MKLFRNRVDIIATVGRAQLRSNMENDEWSYNELLKKIDKNLVTANGKVHKKLDLRFADDRVSVLIETKQNYDTCLESAMRQLQCYVEFEKVLARHSRIIAILANTNDNRIMVWRGDVCEGNFLKGETCLREFSGYKEVFFGKENNKDKVIRSTYELNELLHGLGIAEELRSQFVGTCLLTLKQLVPEKFDYQRLTTKAIIASMEGCLEGLLEHNLHKGEKLARLRNNILEAQSVKRLSSENFIEILDKVKKEILPFINDKTSRGQDILNLFFTTFNKYVGKKDKNQAFTPDHIVHFLCKVAGINRNSRVLDPCCGSGAFLVRALTEAIDDCNGNMPDEHKVKQNHIYGIEDEDYAFGLATTNMLIHGDGNSNVIKANCFEKEDWIQDAQIDTVLMNPPYNAQRIKCHSGYAKEWSKGKKKDEDPTKGFHFVEYIANTVGKGKLVALLPMACAIGVGKEIRATKERMLKNHHLDAVFSLPNDVFHPGATVCACCMVFDLGVRHESAPVKETFFGYFKDDGFVKRKNYGRVEKEEGLWDKIEEHWLGLYWKRQSVEGLSAVRKVTADDEWLCEAYMETQENSLLAASFEEVVREYRAFRVRYSPHYSSLLIPVHTNCPTSKFNINALFDVELTKGDLKEDSCVETKDRVGDELPLVSAGDTDNGFVGYVDKDGDGKAEPFPSNIITVDMFCKAYYQPKEFYAVGHGRVNMLIPKFEMNVYRALYICAVINNERYRFSYGRAVYSGVLRDLQISLPVDAKGNPDWQFMEDYVRALPAGGQLENL